MNRRLSYANVTATVAVVLALGGTATAAVTLPRNSVGSKQIKNGRVTSRDIKNATLTGKDVKPGSLTGAHVADGSLGGADIADGSIGGGDVANGSVSGAKLADGSVTGADVNEASLARVPNANALDGIDSTGFSRSGGRVFSDRISQGHDLVLTVRGYGSFRLSCDDNNTPAAPSDDHVSYSFQQIIAPDALQGMKGSFTEGFDPAKTTLFNPSVDGGFHSLAPADRIEIDQYLRTRTGSKAIRVSAWGFDDDTSTTSCIGMLEAQILR
jgi:uncharacterized protein YjbI with pentapeptide repeats